MKTFPILLTILVLSLATTSQAKESGIDIDTPTITVAGLAEIKVVPDRAVLTYQIIVQENDYEVARAEHERQMKLAMKILADNGIAARDIKTGGHGRNMGYSFYYYWHRYQHYKNTITIPVAVQINDLSKLEKIYQELTEAEVKVPQIQFSSSKLQQYRREAFADAIKAARRKAQIMTSALDQEIGKAIQIAEEQPQNRYWYGGVNVTNSSRSTPNGGQAAMEQFSGGEVTVSAQVKVVFELR